MPYMTTSELERLAHNQGDHAKAALLARIDDLEETLYKIRNVIDETALDDCPHYVIDAVCEIRKLLPVDVLTYSRSRT